jgi:hypothetical protein
LRDIKEIEMTLNCTAIQCPICKQFVTWKKIDFTRPDLAIDWKLEILCGCGPVDDPLVVRHCESEQKVRAYAAVWGPVGDRMRAILGNELDDRLNMIVRSRNQKL